MIFSDHFKHTLKVIGASGLLLLGLFFWLSHKIKNVILPSGHKQGTQHLADYGHGFIVTHKLDGTVLIKPKEIGTPFDIGASVALDGTQTQFYLTTEIFYYRHFELLGGAGITYPVIHPRVMLALGYRMPWKRIDNLSLFVGYDLNRPIVGIYGRFGSN